MNEDSKRRNQLKKDIYNRAQIIDIKALEKIAEAIKHPKNWDIVERVSILESDKNIETQKFILCFDYLNWNECVFTHFDPPKGKKLIEILKSISSCEINKFPELRLIRDSVGRVEPYDSLFSKLSRDVTELKETEFCDGRMFFYIIEPYFHIVSVETNHRNIDR